VHTLLAAAGVRVPAVLGWAEANTTLGYASMLTAELPGHPLAELPAALDPAAVLRAAGRDLAQFNRLRVEGFGWIDRSPPDAAPSLRAAYPSLRSWLDADLAVPLAALAAQQVLTADEVVLIHRAISELSQRCAGEPASLVHGDFDPTHIFVEHGSYTGLIDFGEIRGAHALYDLGHFAVEHRDLLPPLLDGYAASGWLPADVARQIDLTALVIATRRLGTRLVRRGSLYHPDLTALRRGLATL
jgi:Ser/Thr protein kinase RdoA (MazF antagonist)